MRDDAERAPTRGWWLCATAILAVGATLRLIAARDDLWLDEIWSLAQVRRAGGASESW